jgi:hypothetical protein
VESGERGRDGRQDLVVHDDGVSGEATLRGKVGLDLGFVG